MEGLKRILETEKNAKLKFEDYKYSFFILKPNAAKHYYSAIEAILDHQFKIVDQFAIKDYDTVNMALHIEQKESMKYIIPIARFYQDFYGNFGVLVIVKKKDITYENFCYQVKALKQKLREQFGVSYISYVFDTSELGEENKRERLIILGQDGNQVKKDAMNEEGTFMVFSINCIHSPEATESVTVRELKLLNYMGLLNSSNRITKLVKENITKYHTFEFIRDIE